MHATLRHMPKTKISSKEDLYKAKVSQAIKNTGRDSLDTGLALLELAELYDKNDNARDSDPLWRDIEKILANYVKKSVFNKTA
jgi:hypothetical protein